jgi:peptidoglycan/xylan/chitin deacetylase (PgdA/CDA1 family)
MDRIKLPILMYHEVVNDTILKGSIYKMTPSYYIPLNKFEEQMELLFTSGINCITFDDIQYTNTNSKYLVITFDDGWYGNYQYVLPILAKYRFKAVFFVAVNYIGSLDYMNWEDLNDLINAGMSVQSHTLTHRPLQTLSNEEIYVELFESKKIIQKHLNNEVFALSFPHGSYNDEIVKIAENVGYKIMCTSDIKCTYNISLNNSPAVLGRINVTQNKDTSKLLRLIEYKKYDILKEKIIKGTKDGIKRIIGINTYRRIYRKIYNIKKPVERKL